MEKLTRIDKLVALEKLVLTMGDDTLIEDYDLVAFVQHELEMAENKRNSVKPTAKQVENQRLKNVILNILAGSKEAMTIADITAKSPELQSLTNQRISALLTQLRNEECVERDYDSKGRAFFKAVKPLA